MEMDKFLGEREKTEEPRPTEPGRTGKRVKSIFYSRRGYMEISNNRNGEYNGKEHRDSNKPGMQGESRRTGVIPRPVKTRGSAYRWVKWALGIYRTVAASTCYAYVVSFAIMFLYAYSLPDKAVLVTLWRHFPGMTNLHRHWLPRIYTTRKTMTSTCLRSHLPPSYCVKDWGVEDEWAGDTEGTRRYTRRVIQDPKDWEALPVLEPTSSHLSEQLECLRMIRAGLSPNTPLLQTIFSPLAQAKNLAGNDLLLDHLHHHPGAVMKGLKIIAETTRLFIEAARATGINGIFYAIQHAQAQFLSLEEYG